MQATLPISICEVQGPNGAVAYVTLAPADEVAKRGLVTQEIIGQLIDASRAGQDFEPDNFARNRVFVEFLHSVIEKHGPTVPDLVAAASTQVSGWVYVIDGRTPTPHGPVLPEDIVGGFQVEEGEIVAGSYSANPNHRILSHNGFFQLEASLQQRLLDELAVYAQEMPAD